MPRNIQSVVFPGAPFAGLLHARSVALEPASSLATMEGIAASGKPLHDAAFHFRTMPFPAAIDAVPRERANAVSRPAERA